MQQQAIETTKTCKHCGNPMIRNDTECCSRHCSSILRTVPLEQRFWTKVDKNGKIPTHNPDLGPCWNWIAYRTPFGRKKHAGYGGFLISRTEGMVFSHRFSYEAAYGSIPEGQFVLHKCDNPACVNPEHLFLGSQADNVHDMLDKGRDINRPHKLSDEQVRELRLLGGTDSYDRLGKRFGIGTMQAWRIINGERRTRVT